MRPKRRTLDQPHPGRAPAERPLQRRMVQPPRYIRYQPPANSLTANLRHGYDRALLGARHADGNHLASELARVVIENQADAEWVAERRAQHVDQSLGATSTIDTRSLPILVAP